MIRVKIDTSKLEKHCKKTPECCKFIKRFFVKARQMQEYGKTLEFYRESIDKAMQNEEYADIFNMMPYQFKIHHEFLWDVFYDVMEIQYKHGPNVY